MTPQIADYFATRRLLIMIGATPFQAMIYAFRWMPGRAKFTLGLLAPRKRRGILVPLGMRPPPVWHPARRSRRATSFLDCNPND